MSSVDPIINSCPFRKTILHTKRHLRLHLSEEPPVVKLTQLVSHVFNNRYGKKRHTCSTSCQQIQSPASSHWSSACELERQHPCFLASDWWAQRREYLSLIESSVCELNISKCAHPRARGRTNPEGREKKEGMEDEHDGWQKLRQHYLRGCLSSRNLRLQLLFDPPFWCMFASNSSICVKCVKSSTLMNLENVDVSRSRWMIRNQKE
jgi:hypothetical protein